MKKPEHTDQQELIAGPYMLWACVGPLNFYQPVNCLEFPVALPQYDQHGIKIEVDSHPESLVQKISICEYHTHHTYLSLWFIPFTTRTGEHIINHTVHQFLSKLKM